MGEYIVTGIWYEPDMGEIVAERMTAETPWEAELIFCMRVLNESAAKVHARMGNENCTYQLITIDLDAKKIVAWDAKNSPHLAGNAIRDRSAKIRTAIKALKPLADAGAFVNLGPINDWSIALHEAQKQITRDLGTLANFVDTTIRRLDAPEETTRNLDLEDKPSEKN